MTEITIPSSPSWYLSNILACNDEGTALAYGAKHELVILKTSKNLTALNTNPIFIPLAHKDKVNAVVFSPSGHEYDNQLASCSDDGSVHVWDWSTQALLLSHSGHPEGQKVVGVDWSRADPNLVVSVSDHGSVICWDLPSNTIRRLQAGTKMLPICVACCPHDKELIAVGAKAGIVAIFSIKGDGHLRYRLKGQDNEIVSLAWCPVRYNVFHNDETDKDTFLLATGSKNRSIYFWRAGGDGRYETFFNLPTHPIATTGYRSKNGVGGVGNNWVCVRWPTPSTIITSSLFGELLSCDIVEFFNESTKDPNLKTKTKNKYIKLIHGNHVKGLFSIATPMNLNLSNEDRVVWSYALDRHLIACKMENSKVLADITTIGGIVYCLVVSPFSPSHIAIGTGDGKVIIWDMNNETGSSTVSHWNKINGKVMAIAWHPTVETLIAFGTGEGRVGIIDTLGKNGATLLRLYHRRSVYSLIWASPVVDFENSSKRKSNLALFSVGDGDILQYDTDSPDKDPINLDSFFKKCDASAMVSKSLGRTDLTWNFNHTLAAVGNDNGSLYIVDGIDFSLKHTIFAHKKLVQCIVWHPSSVSSENIESPYKSWLASASDNIQIVNVTSQGIDTIACLNTHSEKVVSLSWSPHFNGRLISASYDYTSQVWDVLSGSVLACYDGHHGAVVCCLASVLHQDCYLTGSSDYTVRVWDMNKYNLTKTKTKKQRLSGVIKKFAGVQEAKDKTPVAVNNFKPVNNIKALPEPPPTCENVATEIIVKPHKSKSMFPVTSSGISQAKCLDILWAKLNGCEAPRSALNNELGYLDFFGDSKSIRRLVMVEETNHRESNNLTYSRHISHWSGNMSQTIIDACKKKQLTPWLVSMAPMISHKLWVDCCKSYSAQLAEAGEIYQAVSYLLCIHQIEEAIQLLLDGKFFREAVVLAKARLAPDDPTVRKVMTMWANNCIGTGMQNLAAHCFVSIGSNIDAVDILSRSKEPGTLALAAEIAKKSDAVEMAISLAMRAVNTSLETQDYRTARNTVLRHEIINDLLIWVDICSLIAAWKPVAPENALTWLCGEVTNKWDSIIDTTFERCKKYLPAYSVIAKFLPSTKPVPDSEQKAWAYICGQISLAGAAKMQNLSSKVVLKHLILAVDAAYNYHIHNPANPQVFLQLAAWISPNGPLSELKVYDGAEKSLVESFKTYLACSVIYWLDVLNNKLILPYEDETKMKQIGDVILNCANYIVSRETMGYLKIELESKKLENAIAAAKIKALKSAATLKYCKDLEDEKNETEKMEEMDEKEDDENSKKLATYRAQKLLFEEERVCVPNPYITYCSLRNIMESIISKKCESGKETLAELAKMWENAAD